MHIYHTTKDGRAMVSLPIEWTWPKGGREQPVIENYEVTNLVHAEAEFTHGDDVYRAVRHRTPYGWCHWSLYKNGVKQPHTGDLPDHLLVYVPIEVAKADGCACGGCK